MRNARVGWLGYGLAEIADKDYVAVSFTLGQEQLLAVGRPIEIEDESRGKVGDSPARATRDGLLPYVSGALHGEDELDALSVG